MKKCTFVCGTQAICVGKAYHTLICDYLSLESKKTGNLYFFKTAALLQIQNFFSSLIDALLYFAF